MTDSKDEDSSDTVECNFKNSVETGPEWAECDLLDRYERMVQVQIDMLNGIDEKASTTMRMVALLSGALLAVLPFVSEQHSIEISLNTVTGVILVSVGIGFLLLSIGSCVYTYLSSRMLYGPTGNLGKSYLLTVLLVKSIVHVCLARMQRRYKPIER